MQFSIFIVLLLGAATATPNNILAPLSPIEHTETTIPEEYIVVFKKDANEENIQEHMTTLYDMLEEYDDDSDYKVMHTYNIGKGFRGYSARMDELTLESVRAKSEVDYVERNMFSSFDDATTITSSISNWWKKCVVQKNSTWGLARISHENLTREFEYDYNARRQGQGVNIYIIDSGININHPDLEGRAQWGIDLVDPPCSPNYKKDVIGHGTSVAGVAMSTTYGVAKKATAIAVKITNTGRIRRSDIFKAYEWVAKNHKRRKSVANASFSGPRTEAANDAANALVNSGVLLIASAGNSHSNTCRASPASASEVVAVAASDINDRFAWFSSFGECVELIAPGVAIRTTGVRPGTNCAVVVVSGTSFSAPYAAGIVATNLARWGGMSPQTARRVLLQQVVEGKISGVPPNTPNHLLNKRCTTWYL